VTKICNKSKEPTGEYITTLQAISSFEFLRKRKNTKERILSAKVNYDLLQSA